ncbi:hypothetical protein BRC88_01210 [Halobacteriales archaeon QS_4_69_225]|nr:MAG: hypothetical protein BRC88_01210 [Halobacteriales archaeon QS_4_69_225]
MDRHASGSTRNGVVSLASDNLIVVGEVLGADLVVVRSRRPSTDCSQECSTVSDRGSTVTVPCSRSPRWFGRITRAFTGVTGPSYGDAGDVR